MQIWFVACGTVSHVMIARAPADISSASSASANTAWIAMHRGGALPAATSWRVASIIVLPVETMSSITTGVWPFHGPSGAVIETSRSPRRVFSRIKYGAPQPAATAETHCTLSASGPTSTGCSTRDATYSAIAGAARAIEVGIE